MPLTVTKLREDLYGTLDKVIDTGTPVEIGAKSKLDKLVERNVMTGDPEDLVGLDWSGYWSEAPKSKAPKVK
jgi:hypothetical protein